MNKRTPFLFLLICLIVASALGFQTAAAVTGAAPPLQTSQATAKATYAPVTIPFELNGRHIILKGKVNGQPLTFVLDTGDQYAIVDLDLARRMSLNLEGEVRVGGAGAAVSSGSFVKDASFTLDGLDGFSQPVKMALPLGRTLSPRSGRA